MPTIFDNISNRLIDALLGTLRVSQRADFCVGYFNLRGWKQLAEPIDGWDGSEDHRCRVLVGMHSRPNDELKLLFSPVALDSTASIDLATAGKLKRVAAQEFQEQLVIGVPTDADETALRKLSSQLKARKVQVSLYLSHPLHAKLYLCFRTDLHTPIVAFLGSSNLTFSGLVAQGELNVNVVEQDACTKLQQWFIDRWDDRLSIDISDELAAIIDSSWAREEMLPPFVIYSKIVYHLCQEARAGLSEFRLPPEISKVLLEHQGTAVKIAARYLLRRGGVLLGDVVGLGKTIIATSIARLLQDDPNYRSETLIICGKTLVNMWERHVHDFRLLGKVLSISQVIRELPKLRRYRLVIIDESQVLRNREGKRYRVIRDYIKANESRCLLLSATPYNKTLLDLSSQLRLFLDEDQDLGIRPERVIRETGELEFMKLLQGSPRSLLAFEKSPHPDDWQELMGLFMVRRTRTFVEKNYAHRDSATDRAYLTFSDGRRFYFPKRVPKTLKLKVNANDRADVYSQLQAPEVVNLITSLKLPRYGLGNYIRSGAELKATAADLKVIKGLSRAGKRLIGFCRTSFFKRLESEAHSFIISVERHIIRNYLFLHAISGGLTVPIGSHGIDTSALEPGDPEDYADLDLDLALDDDSSYLLPTLDDGGTLTRQRAQQLALRLYDQLASNKGTRQKWVDTKLFTPQLKKDLEADAAALLSLLAKAGKWNPGADNKLGMLDRLVNDTHRNDKVLVFTQYADTAKYIEQQLKARGTQRISCVTGETEDPIDIINQFSPRSNYRTEICGTEGELRVLIATDLLSEGQNLQDCATVVNFDLPWAIVRLIQRVGRVDRIGQESPQILCYTFLPSEGVENIIRLRRRLRDRLRENAEVIGTDEQFFDEREAQVILDVYAEKVGSLNDDDEEGSIDLASQALQLWRRAIKASPEIEKLVPTLPNVVYSVKTSDPEGVYGPGAVVYTRSNEGVDSLAFVRSDGEIATESPFEILRLASCDPETPGAPKPPGYHDIVSAGVAAAVREEAVRSGALGRPSSARFRAYEALRRYLDAAKGTLFADNELERAADQLYRSPLRQGATDLLNRMLRTGDNDQEIADAILHLHREDRLSLPEADGEPMSMELICSLGLAPPQ